MTAAWDEPKEHPMTPTTQPAPPRTPGAHPAPNPQSPVRNPKSSGFTLIETALVIVIVGVGVLAIMQAEQAFHQHNDFSQRVGTALLLANEIRELTLNFPQSDPITAQTNWGPETNEPNVLQYDDLDDFDGPGGVGLTFSPPIDALRREIPNMTPWSQVITVENVLENFVNGSAAPDHSTDVLRITCRVLYQGPTMNQPMEITRQTWLSAGP